MGAVWYNGEEGDWKTMLDYFVVQARLEKECISGVEHFHAVVCPDHAGDDALYIYIIMEDPAVADEAFFARFRAIGNTVFEICQEEFPGYWP